MHFEEHYYCLHEVMLQCSLTLRNTRFSPDITQDGLGGPVTLVELKLYIYSSLELSICIYTF